MIEAQGLTRRFKSFTAVSAISLYVPDGAILALLGPNGAGKTTTVRMLAGLLAPSEGTATVAGYDIAHDPGAVRACVGLVTDVPGLFEQMRVVPYLNFFAEMYGVPPGERSRRIDELLELFDLSAHRREKMTGFSKGMKQKVALARALIHQPAVLFLDEPTSGLDPLAARTVRELITNFKHSSRSIILCTHDLDEAERLADTVAIMHRGSIVTSDTPARLRERASGEATVHVQFAERCPLMPETLLTIAGVSSPHIVGDTSALAKTGLALEYRTSQPDKINPQVLTRLVNAGAQVISLSYEHSTLEDVYASAIAGEPEDAGAGNSTQGSLQPLKSQNR
jgi:ABC-2 type transport system ATP-binding protein